MLKRRRIHPPRVRYNLKNKKKKETLITLITRINGERVVWSTGEYINPKHWNDKTQRPIIKRGTSTLALLKEKLDQYEATALALIREWDLVNPVKAKAVSQDSFKAELSFRTGRGEDPAAAQDKLDRSDFIKWADGWIEQFKNWVETKPSTYKSIRSKFNNVIRYVDSHHGGRLRFDEITESFIENYKAYLVKEKELAPQTVDRQLVVLLQMIKKAADQRLLHYTEAIQKAGRYKFKQSPKVALTYDEVMRFLDLDLSENSRLERVRDLFIIGILTAQRISDFKRLTPENFNRETDGQIWYQVEQQKTEQIAVGKVLPWGVPTLEKYGYIGSAPFTPIRISDQKFNDYLKEVATLVFGDEQFDLGDGQTVPKAQKITSHTARRTAISLMRSIGLANYEIQQMTGHKNPSQVDGYDHREAVNRALETGSKLNAGWEKLGAMHSAKIRKIS